MRELNRLKGFDFKVYQMGPEERKKLLQVMKRLLEDMEGVVFAYAHGSFTTGEDFRDLDIALWVQDPGESFDYAVDLSAVLETEAGVPVDVHVLNEAPLPFKRHVFTTGNLLFSVDEDLRLRAMDEALRMYYDLEQLNTEALAATARIKSQHAPVCC